MQVIFLTNFFDHHLKEFSDAMFSDTGGDFTLVATKKMTAERIALGYNPNDIPRYVKEYDLSDRLQWNECEELTYKADVVIIGSAPEALVTRRTKTGKLTFKYTERLYKKGVSLKAYIANLIYQIKHFWFKRNYYLLCASAYTYRDFLITGSFMGKAFKWGYFPPTIKYDSIQSLVKKKKRNTILWAGRHIEWKHPEMAIQLAHRLKGEKLDYHLNIIGIGPLTEEIKKSVFNYGLEGYVSILGSMPPEKVREYMEESVIYLFTSDRGEGWGAVLNESMNSACAVVANNMIGAAPYLIHPGENGMIYKDGDFDGFYNCVKSLLSDSDKRETIAVNAYDTIFKLWNSRQAAKNFIALCESLLRGDKKNSIFSGPCSNASIVKYSWFNHR